MSQPLSTPPVIDPELSEPLSMRGVLQIPSMRRLWYAQIISVFGDFLALFAIISVLTFRVHATPQQITGVQIAYLLPIALLGVIVGVFADRWPLKVAMVGSDAVRAALVLLLLLATQIWQYYAVLAAISVVSSLFGPAQGIAIRSAVPMHGLRSANALMQQVMFGMRIIGPAIAAFLVSSFGPVSCYLIDSVSFVGSALLIASVPSIRSSAPTAVTPAGSNSKLGAFWQDMKAGTDFIIHHAGLLFVILALASGMFVLGCFGPLIAIYVRDDLHASNRIFGIASAAIGIGMLIGINMLNTLAKNVSNSLLVYAGLGGIAAGLILLASLPSVLAAFVGNFSIGFAVAAIIIPSQTMIQQESPAALMGRIGSTVMSAIFTAQILGLILSGLVVNYVGVRQVFAGCAMLLVILVAVGRLWMEPKPHPQLAQT